MGCDVTRRLMITRWLFSVFLLAAMARASAQEAPRPVVPKEIAAPAGEVVVLVASASVARATLIFEPPFHQALIGKSLGGAETLI